MSSAPTRSIPGDATLVWLASERAMPLFRPLDRPRAFAPLVALLCVLPPIVAGFSERVTPEDAAWGLHALALNGSPLPPEAAAAADGVVPAAAVRPAALWPTALAFRALSPGWPVTAALPSLLGGAAVIGLLRLLARAAAGPRLALWAVVIAAFHPGLVPLLHDPAPVTAALAVAVAGLWAHLALAGPAGRKIPAAVGVAAAVAAGWLLVGPAAALVPAVIAADALLAVLTVDRSRPLGKGGPTFAVTVVRIVAAAAGVALGLAVELALPLATPPRPGAVGGAGPVFEGGPVFGAESDAASVVVFGPIWGLALLGGARLVRVLRSRAASKANRLLPRIALPWAGLAAALFAWIGGGDRFAPDERYAAAMVVLPTILAAAFGIDEVARRTVAGGWGAVAVVVPLLVEIPSLAGRTGRDGPTVWVATAAGAVAAVWLFLKLRYDRAGSVGLRRGVLMTALLAGVGVTSAEGISAAVGRGDDLGYAKLRSQLADTPAPGSIVLLTDAAPPPSLLFAAAAEAPETPVEVAPTWEEVDAGHVRRFGSARPETLVLSWGGRDVAGAAVAEELQPFGEPILFDGRELLLYTRVDPDAQGGPPKNPLDPWERRN